MHPALASAEAVGVLGPVFQSRRRRAPSSPTDAPHGEAPGQRPFGGSLRFHTLLLVLLEMCPPPPGGCVVDPGSRRVEKRIRRGDRTPTALGSAGGLSRRGPAAGGGCDVGRHKERTRRWPDGHRDQGAQARAGAPPGRCSGGHPDCRARMCAPPSVNLGDDLSRSRHCAPLGPGPRRGGAIPLTNTCCQQSNAPRLFIVPAHVRYWRSIPLYFPAAGRTRCAHSSQGRAPDFSSSSSQHDGHRCGP